MNHDLPRVVSQYGEPIRYHRESASMLEAALLLMKGTPFLYNGEEIGMTNVDYSSLEDFHDVWVANYVKEARSRLSEEQILEYERRTSRVNARTPMQWSAEAYAGFSTVEPAEKVIGNYRENQRRRPAGRSLFCAESDAAVNPAAFKRGGQAAVCVRRV